MKNLSRKLALAAATIVLSLALPFLASTQAFGQDEDDMPPPPPEGRPNGPMQERRGDGDLISRLNLTPEQIKRIREIRQQSAEEWRTTRQRMGRAQRALDEAIYSDTANEAEIEARANEFGAAQTAIARLRALVELRIRRVLTPEQLNILRDMRAEALQRDRERRREMRDQPNAFDDGRRPKLPGNQGIRPGMLPPPQQQQNPNGRRPRP
jgi:Spy/CpxP family protein refolding chaperone